MESQDNYYKFLVTKAQQGSKNPYLELVDLFKNEVFKRALQLTCNIDVANEITSAVFTKAWNHLKLLNEFTPFDLWLKGITVNIALTMFREGKNSDQDVSSKNKSNITTVSDSDVKFLLLDDKTREILILHDLEGYSIESYSEILSEININDITSRLKNAREKITDSETIEVLNSFSENDWNKLISDFDSWDFSDKNETDFTRRLKVIKNYRDVLNNLLSNHYPSENTLDGLKNNLVKDSEEIVKEKKQQLVIKKIIPIKSKEVKKKKYIDDVVKIFAHPEGKQKLDQNLKEKKEKRKKNRSVVIGFISAILIFSTYLLFSSSSYPWKLESFNGTYRINGNLGVSEINLGDIIETNPGTEVEISIDGKSKIFLGGKSAILSLEDKNNSPNIKIKYGNVKINSLGGLKVNSEVNNYLIEDFGSEIEVKLSTSGIGEINVLTGDISVVFNNTKIPMWHSYSLNIGGIIPYRSSLSENLIEQIVQLKNKIPFNRESMSLIQNLGEKDALTLWCLFKVSEDGIKRIIYDRLNYLFPIPSNTTENEILAKNEKELQEWLNSFKWHL